MGIFRDLVSNVANARMKEEQQKLAQNVGLGDILTTLIQNPETDPATYAKASSYYLDLMGKHGGKEGKALQGQIAQFLNILGQKRIMDRALAGGTQPQREEPTVAPGGGLPSQPPVPPGQTLGQPSVNYGGWGPVATLAGTGTDGAQAGRQRGGFGRVLGGLAGVGKEMLGIPRAQQDGMLIPTKEQIARVYGPSEVGLAKEKERGAEAALHMNREDYERQQRADEVAGLQGPEDTKENLREFDRAQRAPSPRTAAEEARALSTAELKSTGEIVPVWVSKRGEKIETLDHKPVELSDIRSMGTPVDPKLTGRMKERAEIRRIKKDPKSTPEDLADANAEEAYMNTQAESAVSLAQIRARQVESASAIVPGTDEFTIAQNVAYGDLTFDAFNRLIGYREPGRKEAIYVKAKQINPNFSEALFMAGYRFFARPQTRQQLAALDNVQAANDDMVRFSELAQRASTPLMNKFELPAGYLLGSRPYSNFQIALTAYADELSGALGFGSATDMTRQLGIKMSDGNVDPATFRSNLQIVQNFIDRKRNSLLGEMSVYGQPGGTTPVIQSRDQYDALPPGSPWRKPSDAPGTVRTKPYPNQ